MVESKDMCVGVCYICGKELVWDANADNCFSDEIGEGYIVKEVVCPECGTVHRVWVNGDSSDEESYCGSINDQGFGNCIQCGGTLIWSGDFMRSDLEGDLDEKDDSLVRSLTCGCCGCSVEVIEPSENEVREGKYPHWKGYYNNSI